MFPEAFAKPDQFNLRSQDYKLLYKYMGMYPPESDYPNYDPKEIWPTYTKFIYFGSEQNIDLPKNIRIFNKCGDAYGYAIDNAYFVDFDKKIEFLVSVVIQSNNNQIYNDNNYEYDSICFPFLKNLGQMLYNVEINREKTYLPNLKKFKFNYK